jgi:hypothetical protein
MKKVLSLLQEIDLEYLTGDILEFWSFGRYPFDLPATKNQILCCTYIDKTKDFH